MSLGSCRRGFPVDRFGVAPGTRTISFIASHVEHLVVGDDGGRSDI